jgi:hypothetical protein
MRAALTQQAMNSIETVVTTTAAPRVTQTEHQDSGRDYLNTNVLRNDAGSQNGNLAAADTSLLSANSPAQSSGAQASAAQAKNFPLVSLDTAESHAFDVRVNPPNTASGQVSGAPDTTFKGAILTIPRKVGETVEKTVVGGIEKAGGLGQRAFNRTMFPGSMLVSPNPKLRANLAGTIPETRPQWRITNGTLMRSTDSADWHEAYPQSAGLQLITLATKGDQVWAGGSNGTIIHSLNAGANWETFKVPDHGDVISIEIISINLNDGWRVKTSTGHTFMSQDHGKTWIPLPSESK